MGKLEKGQHIVLRQLGRWLVSTSSMKSKLSPEGLQNLEQIFNQRFNSFFKIVKY